MLLILLSCKTKLLALEQKYHDGKCDEGNSLGMFFAPIYSKTTHRENIVKSWIFLIFFWNACFDIFDMKPWIGPSVPKGSLHTHFIGCIRIFWSKIRKIQWSNLFFNSLHSSVKQKKWVKIIFKNPNRLCDAKYRSFYKICLF